MNIYVLIFVFIFGTLIGSFINVITYRYNTGLSAIFTRSRCMSCLKTLNAFDLIPIFSFLSLGGKCRFCGSKFSFQYPLVELLSGLLFMSVVLKLSNIFSGVPLILTSIYTLLIVTILLVIFIYDFKHTIIPNEYVWAFNIIALLGIFFTSSGELIFSNLHNIFDGFLVALPIFFLWLVSRGAWMGFGDVKLVLGIGWLFGLSGGFSVLVFAFWVGALISLLLLLFQKIHLYKNNKKLSFKSEIPFAPFILIGMLIVFFFEIGMFELYTLF